MKTPRKLESILLLAAGSSIHTQRWATALSRRGLRVVVLSQHAFLPGDWDQCTLEELEWKGALGYFLNAPRVRRLVARHAPNVVNVHYATGYGMCALLAGIKPYVLSVWGADVYDFPTKSALHRAVVRRSLRGAGRIASTSHVMAQQVQALLGDQTAVSITAFGVDTSVFRPRANVPKVNRIVIGTVKTLAPKYGIDVLLRAYALLRADGELRASGVAEALSLSIVGGGPEEASLKALAAQLGLDPSAVFAGQVPHSAVPTILNGFDVYVAASRLDSESFGVAVIEASSCGVPVVVSDVGGLPEVVKDGVTGFVVPREDPVAVYRALKTLVTDPALRARMGAAGVELVRREYEWDTCVESMLAAYRTVLSS